MDDYKASKNKFQWLAPWTWVAVALTTIFLIKLLTQRSTGDTSFFEGVFVGKALWITFIPFIGMGITVYFLQKRKRVGRNRVQPVLPLRYLLLCLLPFLLCMYVEGAAHLINEHADQSETYFRECNIQGHSGGRTGKGRLLFSNCPSARVSGWIKREVIERKVQKAVLRLKKGTLGKEWLEDISLN